MKNSLLPRILALVLASSAHAQTPRTVTLTPAEKSAAAMITRRRGSQSCRAACSP